MKEFKAATAGMHISSVAKLAIEEAQNEDVFFNFNGVAIPVTKTSTVEAICAAYDDLIKEASESYKSSPEYAEAQKLEQQRRVEAQKKRRADITALLTADESQLRDISIRPSGFNELQDIFSKLSDRNHTYGTCVYAMSIFAEAAFNLMASQLGVTGFQASCADLDIIRRTRHLDSPFALIYGKDLLYPQYDIHKKVSEAVAEWESWAAEEAIKLIAQKNEHVHPEVLAHWERLASKASATHAPQTETMPSDSGESVSAESSDG